MVICILLGINNHQYYFKMTEQLITFETAKLAKEKGFDEITDFIFSIEMDIKSGGWIDENINGLKHSDGDNPFVSAPTQSLLQKWLREEHNIHFIIKVFYDSLLNKTTYVADPIQLGQGKTKRLLPKDTYEEALEAGLFEALNLI